MTGGTAKLIQTPMDCFNILPFGRRQLKKRNNFRFSLSLKELKICSYHVLNLLQLKLKLFRFFKIWRGLQVGRDRLYPLVSVQKSLIAGGFMIFPRV